MKKLSMKSFPLKSLNKVMSRVWEQQNLRTSHMLLEPTLDVK